MKITKVINNIKLKQIPSIVIPILIIGVAIISLLLFYGNKSVEFNIKYSFSEVPNDDFIIEKNAQKNINYILDSLKIEDSYFFGFSGNTNTTIDLYKANAIINTSKLIPNYNMASLKQTFSFLNNTNIESLDFLNLTYYVEMCLNLGIEIDYPRVVNALSKFYDKESNLFFIDHAGSSMNQKIIATAIVKRILGDKLSYESFNLENGVREVYKAYNFRTENDITLYNSGGDIIYCMSVFGMDKEIDKEKLNNWFAYWKDFYESVSDDSLMSALQYSEYLKVARVFEPDYSSKKLQSYYSALTAEDIANLDDIHMLYNAIKNVELFDNIDANNSIKLHIDKAINSEDLFQSNIDIKSTAYGVLLARKTNYPLNEVKLKKYIQQNYIDIPSIRSTYDRTSALYYNIILDQLINGYFIEFDKVYFQSQVDEILKSFRYDQVIPADVISARRIVEIIMHLQIFDVDIQLTRAQRSRILKVYKNALEDNSISCSIIMNDVYIVDKVLTLNLVSDEEFIGIYSKLNHNGGVRPVENDEVEPDILTTYQFMISFLRIDRITIINKINNYEYDYLKEKKAFVETLMVNEGVYKFDKNTTDINNLQVITCANAIRYLEIGGNKDDCIK